MDLSEYRKFFVNGKMEFAYFIDPKVTDVEVIKKEFFEGREWIWQADYCGWKVKSVTVSDDLKEIYIIAKEIIDV